jgi:hypothetical protein
MCVNLESSLTLKFCFWLVSLAFRLEHSRVGGHSFVEPLRKRGYGIQ